MFQNEFDNIFKSIKCKKIGIYGTGNNAKLILQSVKGFQFNCVISTNGNEDLFVERPVVTLQQALLMCDTIIIAAIPSSTNIVWNRISNDIPQGYPVYDMRGNLLTAEEMYTHNIYWEQSKGELCEEIAKHDVISFDLFDTILKRDVLQPRDIWKILEQEINANTDKSVQFFELREKAESISNEIYGTPTIKEIYGEFEKIYDISINVYELADREFELEKRHVQLRKSVWEYVKYAQQLGKTIVITSDMYYSSAQLYSLCMQCGISFSYPIFVSSECKKNKYSGELYNFVKGKYPDRNILHIGDNYDIDVISARRNGIDGYWIMNGYDMLSFSAAASIIDDANTLDDRNMLGRAISELFDDPFILNKNKGKFRVSNYRSLAMFFYPMTYMFARFIFEALFDYDAIIFPSRDGYFFYDIFRDITNKAKYFYASRSAISSSSVTSSEKFEVYISKLRTGSKINVKRFLEVQFQIQVDEELDVSVEEGINKYGEKPFWEKVYKYCTTVIKTSRENKRKYEKYINTLFGDIPNKIAIVDIVAFGTLVHGISNLLNVPSDLIGIGTTAVPNEYIPNKEMAKTIYGNVNERDGDIIYSLTDLSELHLLLELIYSSSDGQFLFFDENDGKHFLEGSEYDSKLLAEVQKHLKNWLGADEFTETKMNISKEFAVSCLRMLTQKYSVVSDDIRSRFRFTDPYEKDRYLLDE